MTSDANEAIRSAPEAGEIIEIEATELELHEDLTSLGGFLSCCNWFQNPL